MSLYSKLKGVCLGLVIALAFGASAAYAQQTGTAQQDGAPDRMQREGRRGERGGRRGHKMMGMMRALRELNLTDAQQSQARAISERFSESTRPQREALQQLYEQGTPSEETRARAKQLRVEIREAMQRARGEVVAILTPEQRTKLEQMELERKARHDERRSRRRSQQDNEQ
ncbi:MAG TPA: Spy/CpxP family protein refolding chaperone [Pyrinomonadaceae bacterium]